jgi:hypothetical protein
MSFAVKPNTSSKVWFVGDAARSHRTPSQCAMNPDVPTVHTSPDPDPHIPTSVSSVPRSCNVHDPPE